MAKMKSAIKKEKIEKYYDLSSRALGICKLSIAPGREGEAREVIQMAECYLSDAKHFQSKGDFVNAFAAINYAHGWIDCAARMKIFRVNDSKLFAVDG
jgi:hypothetical protein